MSAATMMQIERDIGILSRKEQLLLVERIIHRLRKEGIAEEQDDLDSQLNAMASDAEIQREIHGHS